MTGETDASPKAIPVAEFEGEFVRNMEAKLPALKIGMPEGYQRGTHMILEVEVRVRNVGYNEDKDGDLTRLHTLALEQIKLTDVFDPANRPTNVGGNSAGDAWVDELLSFLDGDADVLDFDGEEIPDRLREMLKLYFDRAEEDGPPDLTLATSGTGDQSTNPAFFIGGHHAEVDF